MIPPSVKTLIFLIPVLFLSLTACSSNPVLKVKGNISSTSTLNPNIDGKPMPLSIMFLHLKDDKKFSSSDFFSLFNDPGATLGNDLLAYKKIQLLPATHEPFEQSISTDVKAIGVIAAYRDLEKSKWKSLITIPQKKPMFSKTIVKNLQIDLSRLALNISRDD